MSVKLLQGDCLELMKGIPDKSIDMILCDLPFGTTKNQWDSVIPTDQLWEQYTRLLKVGGVVALFGDEPFSSSLRLSNPKWYRYDCYWIKNRGSGFLNAKRMPLKAVETISIFYPKLPLYNPQMTEGKPYRTKNDTKSNNWGSYKTGWTTDNKGTRYPVNAIHFNKISKTIHPTQKPVDLLQYLIKTYTNEGMTVLDNTMGSGSTGVACVNTGRNFIGMELDDDYFKIAKERIKKADRSTLVGF